MRLKLFQLVVATALVLSSPSALAYIGPGMGGGIIAAIIGIIGTILLALFAILYYPIKRMFKKKKQEGGESDSP